METLIAFIAQKLADSPDQVEVKTIEGDPDAVIQVKVAKADRGKIIGRQGRTVRALRTLINAASAKTQNRTVLEIID
ncbi:KH domain-containing protein [Desulfosarcina sp. OttesenSCG-928-G17]|nr:KH domain-containing protein [Desulfosarcina sp. OttesenSCG-928-G17]